MLKRASLGTSSVGCNFWDWESVRTEDVEPAKIKDTPAEHLDFFLFKKYRSFSTKNLNGLELKMQVEFILTKKTIETDIK